MVYLQQTLPSSYLRWVINIHFIMVYLQQTLPSYLVTGLLIPKHQVGYQYSFYYGVPTTDSTFLPSNRPLNS